MNTSINELKMVFLLCLRWDRLNFTSVLNNKYSLWIRKYPGVFSLIFKKGSLLSEGYFFSGG